MNVDSTKQMNSKYCCVQNFSANLFLLSTIDVGRPASYTALSAFCRCVDAAFAVVTVDVILTDVDAG